MDQLHITYLSQAQVNSHASLKKKHNLQNNLLLIHFITIILARPRRFTFINTLLSFINDKGKYL